MDKPMITRSNSLRSQTPGLAHPPQKCGGHSFAGAFGVGLFMNYPKLFGVHTQKKLRYAFPGQAYLNIDDGAVIQNLRMGTMMQLTVSPKPKRRSSMWHLRSAPIPFEVINDTYEPDRYVRTLQMSIFDCRSDSFGYLTTIGGFGRLSKRAGPCCINSKVRAEPDSEDREDG